MSQFLWRYSFTKYPNPHFFYLEKFLIYMFYNYCLWLLLSCPAWLKHRDGRKFCQWHFVTTLKVCPLKMSTGLYLVFVLFYFPLIVRLAPVDFVWQVFCFSAASNVRLHQLLALNGAQNSHFGGGCTRKHIWVCAGFGRSHRIIVTWQAYSLWSLISQLWSFSSVGVVENEHVWKSGSCFLIVCFQFVSRRMQEPQTVSFYIHYFAKVAKVAFPGLEK